MASDSTLDLASVDQGVQSPRKRVGLEKRWFPSSPIRFTNPGPQSKQPNSFTQRDLIERNRQLVPPQATSRRVKSASSLPLSTQTPSVLKNKPRIPLELQAVFLESSRNGICDKPAPLQAIREFPRKWIMKKKISTGFAVPDSDDEEHQVSLSSRSTNESSCDNQCENETQQGRRPLTFGVNKVFQFDWKKPSSYHYKRNSNIRPSLNRWKSGLNENEKKESIFLRMPQRDSPRQ